MTFYRNQKHAVPGVLLLALSLCPITALDAQQTGEKLLKVNQASQMTDAVMISNVTVAGRSIECGLFVGRPSVTQGVQPFQASDDWLKNLSISLVNRTDKPIVAGSLSFNFLDTGDCRGLPCIGWTLQFGVVPKISAYAGRTGKPFVFDHPEQLPESWKPGETLVLNVGNYLPDIQKRLADSLAVNKVTKLTVTRGAFYFEDGLMWSLGTFYRPDISNPGQFKPLPKQFFPGKRENNFPPSVNQ